MPGAQRAILGLSALCAGATAGAAAPVTYACTLSRDGTVLDLTFDIDPASFAPPFDENDPPRRQVSRVMLGTERFEAEALLTQDGTRGFWAPERNMMLTMARTGAARFSDGAATDWRVHYEER